MVSDDYTQAPKKIEIRPKSHKKGEQARPLKVYNKRQIKELEQTMDLTWPKKKKKYL
jgi:hypothetical protein